MITKSRPYQDEVNNTMKIARFFAIISIVSAHAKINVECFNIIPAFFNFIGSLGVVTFFIMSGYFFHKSKYQNISILF